MKITVTRKTYTHHSTVGELTIDKHPEFKVYTLEDVVRPKGIKIPGQTAIPAGEYVLAVDYSYRFGKFMPHILDVPMFDGIRIHAGNDPSATSGCIVVGEAVGSDFVGISRQAFLRLWNLVAVNTGAQQSPGVSIFKLSEPTTITVVDTQEPVGFGG